jgi:hypothetical protein
MVEWSSKNRRHATWWSVINASIGCTFKSVWHVVVGVPILWLQNSSHRRPFPRRR